MASNLPITPRLVIIEGKDKGKVIHLKDGTAVIGRSKGDVIIQDPRVSRSHVAINFEEKTGTLSFTDLKSLNGTLLNSEPAESGELKDGDRLQLGNTIFDCHLTIKGQENSISEVSPSGPRAVAEKNREPKPPEGGPSESSLGNEPRLLEGSVKENSISNAASKAKSLFSNLLKFKKKDKAAAPKKERKAAAAKPDPKEERAKKKTVKLKAEKPAPPPEIVEPTVVETTPPPPRVQKPNRRGRLYAAAAIVLLLAVAVTMIDTTKKPGGPTANGEDDLGRALSTVHALQNEGKFDEALKQATALKDKFPTQPQPWMAVGDALLALKKYEEAIGAFQKVKTLQPPTPLVHVRLVQAFLRSGISKDIDGEIASLDQYLKAAASSGAQSRELFVEAAQLYLEFRELNQPPAKVIIVAKALQVEIAPDSSIGYKLEAQTLFQQNRAEEALQVLEKGLAVDSQDEWILENIAFARLSLKDLEGAAKAVERWIAVRPTATKALLVMGYLKFNTGDNAMGAQPYVQKILQIAANNPGDPHYPEALSLMAQIYQKQGQIPDAINFYRQSCEAGYAQACENDLLKGGTPQQPRETAKQVVAPPAEAPPPAPAPQKAAPPPTKR